MNKKESLFFLFKAFLVACTLTVFLFSSQPVWAKRPPEIRNQDDLNITKDMHGKELSGLEFVKLDLRGIDFSESNLTGAVFNNSNLGNADLKGADLHDSLAYATDFTNADLKDVNFNNALLMESTFENALIDGADFTDAVLSRIQQKQLCSVATGTNSVTQVETTYSLGC